MTAVARYPDSTKASLEQRLRSRARDRWPQIASLHIRHRGNFSYVDAALADGTMLKLCRLRYVGSASQWQFAIYRASHDDYDESVFPTGLPVGTCQDALDTACGLYLNDPTAWIQPPTNLRRDNLDFHAPLRGSAVADENWVPSAVGGLGAAGGLGFSRRPGCEGGLEGAFSLCMPLVVADRQWTVRGRNLDWRRSPLPGNPRCLCVSVCQSPVSDRGSGGRHACPYPDGDLPLGRWQA